MKTKFVCLAVALFVCLPAWGGDSAPPAPNFSGSFNITGYLEPGLTGPYTWCFDFTTTGSVLFPNSGTWNVPSYSSGWSGTWYQTGDEIIFHGAAASTYIFSWKGRLVSGKIISGRQVEFFIDGSTDTAGTFQGTRISGACPAAASPRKGDPAKN